jgi:hypothetical protein
LILSAATKSGGKQYRENAACDFHGLPTPMRAYYPFVVGLSALSGAMQSRWRFLNPISSNLLPNCNVGFVISRQKHAFTRQLPKNPGSGKEDRAARGGDRKSKVSEKPLIPTLAEIGGVNAEQLLLAMIAFGLWTNGLSK